MLSCGANGHLRYSDEAASEATVHVQLIGGGRSDRLWAPSDGELVELTAEYRASVYRDASDGVIGMADGGIDAIQDEVNVACEFSHASISNETDIDIVSDPADCIDFNKCIVCMVSAASGGCQIGCSGAIPSNIQTANDGFEIYHTTTTTFKTDIPSSGGVFRFDGDIESWPEFKVDDLDDGLEIATFNCDGGDFIKAVDDDPVLNDFSSVGYMGSQEWSKAYSMYSGIFDEDGEDFVAPDEEGYRYCEIVQHLTATMTFEGAEIPGTTLDFDRGTISSFAMLCDTKSYCPKP